jgi:hypothetical protein
MRLLGSWYPHVFRVWKSAPGCLLNERVYHQLLFYVYITGYHHGPPEDEEPRVFCEVCDRSTHKYLAYLLTKSIPLLFLPFFCLTCFDSRRHRCVCRIREIYFSCNYVHTKLPADVAVNVSSTAVPCRLPYSTSGSMAQKNAAHTTSKPL